MTKKIFLLLSSLTISSILHADFVHISKWDRELDNGQKQSIVFFGDIHDQLNAGFKQAKDIANFMAQYKNKNDCVLLEAINDADMIVTHTDRFYAHYNYPEDQKDIQKGLGRLADILEDARKEDVAQQKNNALFLLPHFFDEHGVAYDNVDFRQTMTCDAPRLNISNYQDGHLIIPFVIEQLFNEIASYEDTPELNAFYSKVLNRYKPFMRFICNIMREHKIIFQDLPDFFATDLMKNPLAYELKQFKAASFYAFNYYHERLGRELAFLRKTKSKRTKDKLVELFKHVLDLSSVELIDAYILHLLHTKQVKSNERSTISVVVGQAHMRAVEKYLPQLGYERVGFSFDEDGVDVAAFCAKYPNEDMYYAVADASVITSLWSGIVGAISYVIALAGF